MIKITYMKKLYFGVFLLLISFAGFSQQTWDLEKCVNYALEHNISVRQADVQARLSALQLKQSQAMRIPTLSFNSQAGENFGRFINPTTNTFSTTKTFSQTYSAQSGITLFNFFNVQNSVKSAKAQNDADNADIERAKSDVVLNVAAAYLQYLQSLEQVNIAAGQIDLTEKQLDLTKKQVAAGSVPELNAAQLESQLSTDSSTLITNQSTMEQDKLQLLALLDISADSAFEVSLPDAESIPLQPLSDLQPQDVYTIALGNQYQQKVDSLKILSTEYAAKSAKSQMYPTIQAFGSVSSNYANSYKDIYGNVLPYGKQLFNANLSEFLGISLNVPIFSNRQLRTAYQKAKENVASAKLQQELNDQTLQQNVYKAYSNAKAGIESYNSNTKAEQYAQYAYDLAQKRYDIGMLSASDYLVAANNLYTAKVNRAAAHYDYIFRLKVLEFYKYNHVDISSVHN